MLLRGRMEFYGTGTGQALGLDRMQSLLDLPCVLGAASIHYAGQGLKKMVHPAILSWTSSGRGRR